MMGGGAGGALMYLIFDPEMENFPEVRTEIEEYVSILVKQVNGRVRTSHRCQCLQMKLATHSTVKI